MNAEQLNLPEPNLPVAAPQSPSQAGEEGGSNGSGSNGKSRRRRRKRKGRSNAGTGEGGTVPQVAASAEGGEQAPAPPAQAAAPQQQRQNNGGQQRNQAQGDGQGTKRWKKKKGGGTGGRGGDGNPRPEPGNSLQGSNSSMGNRGRTNRGKQQRGPRAFVGPMDHSYREANGNFADSPASTIDLHGGGGHRSGRNNHRGHFNEDRLPPELMHHQRAVAIAEDAPTHIYFFIEDLFFTAKIQEAARLQGVKVAFMKPDKDIVAHLAELPEHDHPSLIVFDLNNANAKPLTLIPKLKNKLKKGTSIVGFLSHLQGDLKAKAVEAGCNSVMPRAAFSQNLPNLLRRYGAEDEHEPNFNM